MEYLAFDGDALSEEGAPAGAGGGASEGDGASYNKTGALSEDEPSTAATTARYGDGKMLEQVCV